MGKILVLPAGRMANQMIQRIAAESIAEGLGIKKIYSSASPEWGKKKSHGYNLIRFKLRIQLKFRSRAIQMASGNKWNQNPIGPKNVIVAGNMLDIDLLNPSKSFANAHFPIEQICSCCRKRNEFDFSNYNIVHVRLGDIWRPNSKTAISYFPLSLNFYEAVKILDQKPFAILAATSSPEEILYVNEIAKLAKDSVIINPGCALGDFQFLRSAETVTLSTSTYAWLSTWMSQKAKTIYVPDAGLFNKTTRPDINLVSKNRDSRIKIIPAERYTNRIYYKGGQ